MDVVRLVARSLKSTRVTSHAGPRAAGGDAWAPGGANGSSRPERRRRSMHLSAGAWPLMTTEPLTGAALSVGVGTTVGDGIAAFLGVDPISRGRTFLRVSPRRSPYALRTRALRERGTSGPPGVWPADPGSELDWLGTLTPVSEADFVAAGSARG